MLEKHLNATKAPLTLAYAIPDHPWVDSVDGAAVRIAMTVASTTATPGELNRVTEEIEIEDGEHLVELSSGFGRLAADLKVGADVISALPLLSNMGISNRGVQVIGSGFILPAGSSKQFDPLGGLRSQLLIRPYLNGKDITPRTAASDTAKLMSLLSGRID